MAEIKKTKIEVTDGTLIPGKGENSVFSAWRIAFFGAIALIIILPIMKPDPYFEILKFIPDGVLATFKVTVLSILLSTAIGLLQGLEEFPE